MVGFNEGQSHTATTSQRVLCRGCKTPTTGLRSKEGLSLELSTVTDCKETHSKGGIATNVAQASPSVFLLGFAYQYES